MKRLIVLLACGAAAPSFAWDPLSVFNNAVQGQINRQIQRGVNEAFRSITTPSTETRPTDVAIRDASPGDVVMYATPYCGYCRQAKAHMQRKGVAFVEKDISVNRDAEAEYRALGGRGGVPYIIFGSQKLSGFSAASFDQAYVRFQAEQGRASEAAHPPPAATMQTGAAPAGPELFVAGDVLVARIARVKLLSEAQAGARPIGQLAKHEEVIYLGEAQGRYVRVKSAEAEGWAEQTLLGKP